MQRFVVYTPRPDESCPLLTALRSRVANNGDEVLDSAAFTDADRAASALQAGGVQLIGWDVSAAPGRLALQTVRAVCREAFLLVIAEPDTSPLLFLTPGLRPDSLLLRPIRPPEARRAAEEMASELRRQAADVGQCFTLNTRAGSQKIPYSAINYFEARDRRLYLRLDGQEIGFTGTLEKLEGQLPANFCRAHRSFIVNIDKIRQLYLSENYLLLVNNLTVPLSRSYKKNLKELCHG